MSRKKIKVKVKKRKLKVKRILICLLLLVLMALVVYYFSKLPIKNIYVIGNEILSDKEIIDISGLSDYPSFLIVNSSNVEKKIKENVYVKEALVKKKFNNKIYIYVTEKKILCSYENKLILEDASIIENIYNINSYPILLSDVLSIKDKFVTSFAMVQNEILLKISEIEYSPNDVDEERFVLMMNDGNLVYITLSKIEKINKYNSIYSTLDGKKGVIYLDSGDYVEVKEE